MSYNYLFKIVIIGDHNCGKSCILLRFAENTFRDDHITTLGVDFKLKTIKLDKDRVRLELWDTAGYSTRPQLQNAWSLARIRCSSGENESKTVRLTGQKWIVLGAGATARFSDEERTFSILKKVLSIPRGMERYRTIYNSYYHSAHAVMCVYDICDPRSFENIKNYWIGEVRRHAPQNAVLMLVGNKCDDENNRKVEFKTAEKFASDHGISLFEVSAKSGINVEDAFMEVSKAMRDRLLLSKMDHYYDSSDSEEISGGFHVDGVITNKDDSWSSCCSGANPKGTFV